jgi:pSer/pThr/pTyr-binding forkhead associated (FHA) protein
MSTMRLVPKDPRDPTITLADRAITVGRAEANDVVLPRPEVSRHHARLEPADAGWRAVDLDSTNGTWVNGERASQRPLSQGDEVVFGTVRFTVDTR